MLFTQIEFYLFFGALVAALAAIRNFALRKLLLLAASYYFYAYWDWRLAGLLMACTVVNYGIAGALARSTQPSLRKGMITLSIVYSLGILGFFKYFNFFVDSLKSLVGAPLDHFDTLDIILPVGISFYTFQTLSYTIDVYRGTLAHRRKFTDFALFVAFFPQLVAGPIVRASEFLPQLDKATPLTWPRLYDGFRQFVFGLFKKVFIADQLAQIVDFSFDNSEALSGITLWVAVLAYAVQIYCDFSGYSDMAIGAARILGFDLSINFNHPYIATSIRDFWRRWHISLSSWLRDYLYIPLGGNRLGPRRTYINLMLTMILGGLWHGAAWTFVFWGALHGTALCIDRALGSRKGKAIQRISSTSVPKRLVGWLTTLLVVIVGWTLFRAQSFESALNILSKMFTLADGVHWIHPFAIGIVFLFAVHHAVIATGRGAMLELRPDSIRAPAVLFTMIWLVLAFYPKGFQPFIYFQF